MAFKILNEEIIKQVVDLYLNKNLTLDKIAPIVGVSRASCSRALVKANIKSRPTTITRRQFSIDENFFENIDTEEKAYWLGFIAADGNVSKKKYCIHITQSANDKGKDHLQKFLNSIKSSHKIYFKEKTKSYQITISNVKMHTDLLKHGIFPQKSLVLKPWDGPIHLLVHYWRGLFDGDGCIRRKNKNSFSIDLVGTKDICEAFRNFINNFYTNGVGHLRKNNTKGGNTYTVEYGIGGARIMNDICYKNSTIYLDRKKKIFSLLENKNEY